MLSSYNITYCRYMINGCISDSINMCKKYYEYMIRKKLRKTKEKVSI